MMVEGLVEGRAEIEARLERLEAACQRLEARWAADREITQPETEAALDRLWWLYLRRDIARAELS